MSTVETCTGQSRGGPCCYVETRTDLGGYISHHTLCWATQPVWTTWYGCVPLSLEVMLAALAAAPASTAGVSMSS